MSAESARVQRSTLDFMSHTGRTLWSKLPNIVILGLMKLFR